MEDREINNNNKKQKHHHHRPYDRTTADSPSESPFPFKPTSTVKGLRFGGQFVVKSFTIRRARPLEFLQLLSFPPNYHDGVGDNHKLPFQSTVAFVPTNFTILAHHAWHTLTLGLGARRSKAIIFVFETEALKHGVGGVWPAEIPLGDVNKRLIRRVSGCEMARFKFRKGCLTFYIYAVREKGRFGFSSADDLRKILQAVAALNDFLDHTAMLALPNQRSIGHGGGFTPTVAAMTAH